MAATSEPLLSIPKKKRKYYENCPACKQDKKNEENSGIPFKDFIFIWVACLCSALPISFLFPFLYFMIRDLHIAKTVEDIGFYAGFVGSSFMLGRVLTSILWGMVADRYGRKPVIIISSISVIIFNTLFGFSTNIWMAVSTRLLLGIFSGILGPIKAYATEVCRNEYKALGLSVVSTSRGIGLIIGPAIGGYLSQPAEKFPDIITKESIFGKFPYLLPCLCISLFAAGAFIACFWLPQHISGQQRNEDKKEQEEDYFAKFCHSCTGNGYVKPYIGFYYYNKTKVCYNPIHTCNDSSVEICDTTCLS